MPCGNAMEAHWAAAAALLHVKEDRPAALDE